MKKPVSLIISSCLLLGILLSGCGNNPTPAEIATVQPATATQMPPASTPPTGTPDACAPENVQASVEKVHRHTSEFDDAASLLSANLAGKGLQPEQLSDAIANLQKIRRGAESEAIPACLTVLKALQIQHMDSGVNAFLTFLSAKDQQAIDQSLAIAAASRQLHDQYLQELSRLLGITPIPVTVIVTPLQTPSP